MKERTAWVLLGVTFALLIFEVIAWFSPQLHVARMFIVVVSGFALTCLAIAGYFFTWEDKPANEKDPTNL